MSNTNTKTLEMPRLSIKTQTFATIGAVIAAVLLPQILHLVGAVSGMGTALGETFLPMHLPIILVGLLAGPYAGAIAGMISPLLSFAVTGMPGAAMLPFMMIELFAYGLLAGLLRTKSMPTIVKVLAVQIGGRAIRAVAICFAVYVIGSNKIPVSIIFSSIRVGLIGLLLQWALIPLIIYRVEDAARHEG